MSTNRRIWQIFERVADDLRFSAEDQDRLVKAAQVKPGKIAIHSP